MVHFDRKKFFDAIRPAFGSLSTPQVKGMSAILDACTWAKVEDIHHVANILSNVRRETGGYMAPIKETVMKHHKNKEPTDAVVKSRLTKAWRAGKLPWVRSDYWSKGMFGRGQIQVTHAFNYKKMGARLGVDLMGNPDLALDPTISARIAVVGMVEGMFTGKKLSHYDFPGALDAPPSQHPRRIVNGKDGSDGEIAKWHRLFASALSASVTAPQRPAEPQPAPTPPAAPQKTATSPWAALLAALVALFNGKRERN